MRADGPPIVATIVDLTHDGVGVADVDGRKVFVADALPGERVEIALRKRRRKLQEADLVRVLDVAERRAGVRHEAGAVRAEARDERVETLLREAPGRVAGLAHRRLRPDRRCCA